MGKTTCLRSSARYLLSNFILWRHLGASFGWIHSINHNNYFRENQEMVPGRQRKGCRNKQKGQRQGKREEAGRLWCSFKQKEIWSLLYVSDPLHREAGDAHENKRLCSCLICSWCRTGAHWSTQQVTCLPFIFFPFFYFFFKNFFFFPSGNWD